MLCSFHKYGIDRVFRNAGTENSGAGGVTQKKENNMYWIIYNQSPDLKIIIAKINFNVMIIYLLLDFTYCSI